jgi:type II secretory pathway pseudopilin PulG
MNTGFGMLEIIIALVLSLSILSIVIINVSESTAASKKITSNQQVLESIFHTVDTIKSDLTKCGMRLQEASRCFDLPVFDHSDRYFKLMYGISSEVFRQACFKGDKTIIINKNEYIKKNKRILIYNPDYSVYEFNIIKDLEHDHIILSSHLQNDYPPNSILIVLKIVEYKLYQKQNILKRKVDRGYFQPLIENVSDFYIQFFPDANAVLYRIEVNRKEQIRGYIYLINMV